MLGARLKCSQCAKHHRIHLRPNEKNVRVEMTVTGRGQSAYVWIGGMDGRYVGSISGPATLRKLAKAILAEVGED